MTPVASWLKHNFLPYQTRWILGEARFELTVKGRQLGITDAAAARCVLRGRYYKRPQIVLSASQDNANELIAAARRHSVFLSRTGDPGAARFSIDNTECLAWEGGGSITARASNTRTARSSHGDLYLDEFAYQLDSEAIWAAAAPMATRSDWSVRVWSTPNGATGQFYEWCESPPPGWAFSRIALDDACADGLAVDRSHLLALVGGDERIFAEAYQCQFLDANLQYLPSALIKGTEWSVPPDLDGPSVRILAGLDVGRHVDLTALTIVALVDEHIDSVVNGRRQRKTTTYAYLLAVLTCKRTAFKQQYALVDAAREAFKWERLFIDRTGLGEAVSEEFTEKYGAHEVVAVAFTEQSKADMATSLFRWMNEGRLRIVCEASEAREVRADMNALRRVVTKSGNVTYEVPKSKRGHGDRLWSLAMPLRAALEPVPFRGMGQTPVTA